MACNESRVNNRLILPRFVLENAREKDGEVHQINCVLLEKEKDKNRNMPSDWIDLVNIETIRQVLWHSLKLPLLEQPAFIADRQI